jgi:alanine dehydrogenase
MAQEFLLISQEEILQNVPMSDFIQAAEDAFRAFAQGKTTVPPKVIFPVGTGIMAAMPAFVEEPDALVIKVANARKTNVAKGLPRATTQVFLYDGDTGLPLALMDGGSITGMRTGAAGGVAAKYLARPDSRAVGIVGAGVQGRTHLIALQELFPVERARVYDQYPEAVTAYVSEMSERTGLDIKGGSLEETVRESDILVTVTGSHEPLVKSEWVRDGTHINAFGADKAEEQELETAVHQRSRVFVDWMVQCELLGDVSYPLECGAIRKEDIAGELGQVVTGEVEGRQSDEQVTVFDATGVAVQDALAARMIYRAALDKGLGHSIEL